MIVSTLVTPRLSSPRRLALLLLASGAAVSPAAAQTGVVAPQPTPSATSPLTVTLPTPVPTLTPITPPPVTAVRPTPTPTPPATRAATPTPRPTPSPTAVPMTRVRQVPTSPLSRVPASTPTPATTPTPTPSVAAPAPVALPSDQPVPAPTVSVPEAAGGSGTPLWPFIVGGLVVIAGIGFLMLRRRGEAEEEVEAPVAPVVSGDAPVAEAVDAPMVLPASMPTAAAVAAEPDTVSPTERARLEVSVQPRRAGVNLVTATADLDVLVHNAGTRVAERVAVAVTLTSASAGQDRVLADLFAGPPRTPAVAPFTLAPGERRTVRVLATMPRQDIVEMRAGGRPMFVPVAAIDVRYRSEGAEHQHAQAIAIGVERTDTAKLAPFWLDAPSRMFETVAARPHGAVVER